MGRGILLIEPFNKVTFRQCNWCGKLMKITSKSKHRITCSKNCSRKHEDRYRKNLHERLYESREKWKKKYEELKNEKREENENKKRT